MKLGGNTRVNPSSLKAFLPLGTSFLFLRLFNNVVREVMGMSEKRLGEFIILPLSLIPIKRIQILWSPSHTHHRLTLLLLNSLFY